MTSTVPITVLMDGTQPLPDGHIRPLNRFDVALQCLGDAMGNSINVTWLAIREGESPQVISADSEFFQVRYNYNEANLTVINSARPFLGKLRCYSPVTGERSTITVAQGKLHQINVL